MQKETLTAALALLPAAVALPTSNEEQAVNLLHQIGSTLLNPSADIQDSIARTKHYLNDPMLRQMIGQIGTPEVKAAYSALRDALLALREANPRPGKGETPLYFAHLKAREAALRQSYEYPSGSAERTALRVASGLYNDLAVIERFSQPEAAEPEIVTLAMERREQADHATSFNAHLFPGDTLGDLKAAISASRAAWPAQQAEALTLH